MRRDTGRAADGLRAGSGLPRRQSRHGGRAARQRLRGRHAAGPALLRFAPRAQRRSRRRADPGAADDRPVPAGSLRRDHQQRRRLRLAPAALRTAARRTIRPMPRARGPGTGSCATFRSGWLRSAAVRRSRSGAPGEPILSAAMTSRTTIPVTWCTGRRLRASRARCCAHSRCVVGDRCPESTWCCGAPGCTRSRSRQQAELLLARKVRHIVDTGAPCSRRQIRAASCRLRGVSKRTAARIRVVHPVSLLAAAYRAESQSISQGDTSRS